MNTLPNAMAFALRRAVGRWLVVLAVCAFSGNWAGAAVQARDIDGQLVQLAQPARRIVSLAPHLTELLFAVGAGERVVGTVAYSDHPEAARAVPRVGDSALLDMERIAALKPDLLVVWRHGNSAQQLQRLQALHVPVFASEARSLADIAQAMRSLGALAGTDAQATTRADAFEQAVSELRSRYAQRLPLRVFYQIWPQPLMTVNGEHLISQVLALCGAHNVFASQRLLTPTVTEEAVLLADPDAIVTGRIDGSNDDPLAAWRRLTALRARRLGNFVTANADLLHRQSDRVILGARELCDKLDAVRTSLAQPR
jgi:iron complex transport system substrate-binding protein